MPNGLLGSQVGNQATVTCDTKWPILTPVATITAAEKLKAAQTS